MSNQFLKLRRSAVPGKIPDTGSIELGEIALNTHDGLAYMKKSGSNGEEIIAIGTGTSGSFTGSFTGNFTGSLQGTSSFATTASYALQAFSSSYAISASFSSQALSSSYANIAGFANDYIFTSSLLEYYVDRRFTGGCEVTILSDKTISSSNATYLTQLSASRVGDPNYPWPDPWSANLRASASIASGQSTNARIIVKTGNSYTYGSSVLTQNGDMTGSLTNNLRPDIAVSQSNYNLRVFDLITPSVEYYFEPSASLYNINKTWRHELVYYTSSDWSFAPTFKITGQGKFVGVYGQSNGFNFAWGSIYAPRAEITLQADHIIQNMWNGWQFGIGQKIDIDVNKWWSYSAHFLKISPNDWPWATATGIGQFNWPSQSLIDPSASLGLPVINVNINELRWGQNQFTGIGPHANDFWAGLHLGSAFGGVFNVNINKITAYTRFTDGMIRFDPVTTLSPSASNNTVNINIGYISGSRTNVGGPITKIARYTATSASYDNLYYKLHVDKFDAYGVGFGASDSITNISNSTIIFSCNDYRNYLSPAYGDNACIRIPVGFNIPAYSPSGPGTGSFTNNQVIVTGNYRNYASSCPIIGWTVSNYLSNNSTSYNTLILDNFKGYQLATQSNAPVLSVLNYYFTYSTGSYIVIKDSILYSSGSNVINNNTNRNPPIIFNDTIMNRDITGSFNAEGTFNISSNLDKLIY